MTFHPQTWDQMPALRFLHLDVPEDCRYLLRGIYQWAKNYKTMGNSHLWPLKELYLLGGSMGMAAIAATRVAATVPIKRLVLHFNNLPLEHNDDCTFHEWRVECGDEMNGNRNAFENTCYIEVLHIHG